MSPHVLWENNNSCQRNQTRARREERTMMKSLFSGTQKIFLTCRRKKKGKTEGSSSPPKGAKGAGQGIKTARG